MSAECDVHGTDLLWDETGHPNYCPSCDLEATQERADRAERELAVMAHVVVALGEHREEARRERDAAESLLENLLARIFRDGGQRAASYSTKALAVVAADRELTTLLAENERG